MSMTPNEFFSKNAKWFILVLFVLFLFKSVQSCNRNMRLNINVGDYIHQIDSLKNMYNIYYKESQDSIKELNYLLKLANEHASSANERARAVESAVEKIRTNTTTTVVVRGAEELKDTTKKK